MLGCGGISKRRTVRLGEYLKGNQMVQTAVTHYVAIRKEFYESPEVEFLIDPTNRLEVVEAARIFLTRTGYSFEHIRSLSEDFRIRTKQN